MTYGPFPPDLNGDFIGNPERLRTDLKLMSAAGVNVLRIYHVPPDWFLDILAEFEIKALITVPWAEHVAFLDDRKVRSEIQRTMRKAVERHKNHPAIFGYLVGNEIPASIVRWLGVRRVTEFVENLITIGRTANPLSLFSYASYPPTEFLLPQNVDFYTFNVYLHRQRDFESYLLRLQNLVDEKPLVMGEFGMDTIRHPQEEQAEMIRWHVESVVRCGLAGTFIYAWTDEWFTGGMNITDWAFGVVDRERVPKKAYFALKEQWTESANVPDALTKDAKPDAPIRPPRVLAMPGSVNQQIGHTITGRVPLPSYPKVSVIVCSYNGAQTLEPCLRSLLKVDYPNYEVVVVDDGSTDSTPDIVAKFADRIVAVRQSNMGLSYARNVGAKTASGEILAYTDGDCMADPDWLYYLVGTLLSGNYAGVGGPNISPPAMNWVQACVAAAPGGPSHVLLTDVVAEHIPGCNMAFHRWAFDLVGGFNSEYRKAGDDVDFCWRLQNADQVIAFSPSAIVWHYRRFTLKAFRKQQEGYGEAESMLRFNHLIFFGPTGTAKWKGMIYGAPRFTWLINQPIIYHGVFGQGFFQSIYPTPRSEIANYVSSVEWFALTIFIFALSLVFAPLGIVSYLMFGATFSVALSYMIHARLEAKFDTVPARLLVMVLAFSQPLVRGWARYYTWLKFKRTPGSVLVSDIPSEQKKTPGRFVNLTHRRYWNESGQGREQLLASIAHALETEGWRYSIDTGWKEWDIQIYGNLWWMVRLLTVTEYHGGPKCLTRVEIRSKPVVTTVVLALLIVSLLLTQYLSGQRFSPAILAVSGFAGAYLLYRAYRLKVRVADLVNTCAQQCGLDRIYRRKKPKSNPDQPANTDDAGPHPHDDDVHEIVSPGAGG